MAKKDSAPRKTTSKDAPKTNLPAKLNSKNRKTLEAIFENPVRSDIDWDDIERLFVALGGIVDNKRKGSRVGVSIRGVKALFHEPHPNPETDKGAVQSVREYLRRCGIYQV